MAIKHDRGWIWDAREKQELKAAQRRARRHQSTMQTELRFLEVYAPEIFNELKPLIDPILDCCSTLLTLDARPNSRKYLKLSPREVREVCLKLRAAGEKWNAHVQTERVQRVLTNASLACAAAVQKSMKETAELKPLLDYLVEHNSRRNRKDAKRNNAAVTPRDDELVADHV